MGFSRVVQSPTPEMSFQKYTPKCFWKIKLSIQTKEIKMVVTERYQFENQFNSTLLQFLEVLDDRGSDAMTNVIKFLKESHGKGVKVSIEGFIEAVELLVTEVCEFGYRDKSI